VETTTNDENTGTTKKKQKSHLLKALNVIGSKKQAISLGHSGKGTRVKPAKIHVVLRKQSIRWKGERRKKKVQSHPVRAWVGVGVWKSAYQPS